MTLELTKIEYLRLQSRLESTRCRSAASQSIDADKERKIVAAIKEGLSKEEIRKTCHTSDKIIVELRKKYGFWGA
jgi:hypothetical protein